MLAIGAVAGIVLSVLATVAVLQGPGSSGASGTAPVQHFDVSLPDGIELQIREGKRAITISPDGRYVVYVGGKADDVNSLYRRDVYDGTTVRISGVEEGELPFISPDSDWVGFMSGKSVMKVPIGGGEPESLADVNNSFGGAWGPEGNIVYSWDVFTGLHEVPEQGGGSEPITDGADGGAYWTPSFLPGGESLLATESVTRGKGDYDVVLLDLETRKFRKLIDMGVAPQYVSSGHIVFARERDLYAVRFDLESLEVVGDPVPVVRGLGNGSAVSWQFAVSDAGVLVYVQEQESRLSEIVRVDLEGNVKPYAVQPMRYRFPRVSPDATRVAVTVEEIHDADVWIVELLDGTKRPITEQFSNGFPIWLKDGNVIFSSDRDEDGEIEIYRQAVDGSAAAELLYSAVANGHARFHVYSVSADGSILVGFGDPGDVDRPRGLSYVAPETSSEINLLVPRRDQVPVAVRLNSSKLSPQEDRVAYVSNETGKSEIWVTTFPEPGPKVMVSSGSTPGDALYPIWAPGGSGIYYRQDNQMWFVELDADPAARPLGRRALFDTSGFRDGDNYAIENYDLFPDGESFLMLRAVGDSPPPAEIKVILNFLEKLERLLPTATGEQ